jgi:hypothetical protein
MVYTSLFVSYRNVYTTQKVASWVVYKTYRSLILKQKYRLRVPEKRVLRRMFGPKRDEVTGGWRKLHNEKLHNLFSSPSIIIMIKCKGMRWEGYEE